MKKKKQSINKSNISAGHKITVSLLLMVLLRALANVPVPMTDSKLLKALRESNASFGFLDASTGGALSSLSVMALSVTPYITAQIMVQMWGLLIPAIRHAQQGSPQERRKVDRWTTVLATVLGILSASMLAVRVNLKGLLRVGEFADGLAQSMNGLIASVAGGTFAKVTGTGVTIAILALIWTLGAVLTAAIGMWITHKYEFNGISLILLMNMLVTGSQQVMSAGKILLKGQTGQEMAIRVGLSVLVVLLIFLIVTMLLNVESRLQVNYTTRKKLDFDNDLDPVIPIKLIQGSVMPVIFASSTLAIPAMVKELFSVSAGWTNFLDTAQWFKLKTPIYSVGAILYVALIVVFSFYNGQMVLNSNEIADRLKRSGGVLTGVRSGEDTLTALNRRIRFMTWWGALGLSVIALVPMVISGLLGLNRISFLGTSALIIVGVILDLRQHLKADRIGVTYARQGEKLFSRSYESTKKSKDSIGRQLLVVIMISLVGAVILSMFDFGCSVLINQITAFI